MKFEWDDNKEQKNIAKHGIDFGTAILVFGDDNRIEMYDAIRIISARRATQREKEAYYDNY